MFNYISTNLENIITCTIITLIIIIIYDLIKRKGKLHINIDKVKINIQNRDNWNDTTTINDTTKGIDLDIKLELYNHKSEYNSIRRIKVTKRNLFKNINIENFYLNITNTSKTISGSSTFEKLIYINLLPHETKLFNVKIKLTKEEFLNIKKNPLYITYKEGLLTKKIKINKYLRRKK